MSDPREEGTRWALVEALVDELLDLEPGARAEALQRAAQIDPDLAAKAGRWLRGLEGEDLLATSVASSFPDLVSGAAEQAASDRSGARLGPYRLNRVLGRGGMGVVYLAERADKQFEKRVAVKLMPRGLESEERERRFLLERQVLAHLEHPNIARLLDGGVTDEGYPYLVMELVEGEPIDVYCETHGLGLEERLRLFLEVCDGVQHAHQNLVIHRDLKPANILVTAERKPKLLDFGVAKLTEADPDTGEPTRYQPRTRTYASPEQLANEPVSTASDVYSLAVVLYRLLTGRLPGPADAQQPPLASRAAEQRDDGREPVSWTRRLAGDLDRILAKALAGEPAERYATVSAFAEDLRRFLSGQPVSAREPTAGYRLRKFVSRHRVPFFASTAAALALATATVMALWQGERARLEAERAGRVAGLLSGLFVDADPWAATSEEVTVLDLIGSGVERVRSQLAEDPRVRTELLHVLGRAYTGLGHPELAIPILEEVVEQRQALFGERDPRTAEAMISLGAALQTDGRLDDAHPLIEGAVAIAEEHHGRDAADTVDALFALALLRKAQAEYPRQEAILRRIVDIHKRSGSDPNSALALALGELSVALDYLGRDAESLEVQREALEMAQATFGRGHPQTESLRNNMGLRLDEAGRQQEAVVHLREAFEAFEQRPGVHEAELVAPLSNLGGVLLGTGDFEGAGPYIERAAEIARRVHPPEAFARIGAEINLATLYRELGRLGEAETIYRSALERFEARLGGEHQATARARALLGMTLARAGDLDAGEAALRAALAVQRDPERDPMALDETLLALGRLLVDRGTPAALDEAELLLAEALASRREGLPSRHWSVAEVQVELALVEAARGRKEVSAAAAAEILASELPEGDFRRARSRRIQGGGR